VRRLVSNARESDPIACETYEDLVEEVLDELLLQRARSQEAVEVGSEELGDEVAAGILVSMYRKRLNFQTYMSSRGEIKMSLKLIICKGGQFRCWRTPAGGLDGGEGVRGKNARSRVGDA
jgi:hypothetical protein